MTKHRDKLAEMLDEGVLDAARLANDILGYLSDDECKEFARMNDIELFPEEEEPEKFTAGWNMPGYLPESLPEEFDDANDARLYISEAMDREAETFEPGSLEEVALSDASIECLRGSGEYAATVGRYHYFVTKV